MIGESDWDYYITNGLNNFGSPVSSLAKGKSSPKCYLATKRNEALELIRKGVDTEYISEELDSHKRLLYRWKNVDI